MLGNEFVNWKPVLGTEVLPLRGRPAGVATDREEAKRRAGRASPGGGPTWRRPLPPAPHPAEARAQALASPGQLGKRRPELPGGEMKGGRRVWAARSAR